LEVIEIKRAVFLEPRVVVDLLEMEIPERRGESIQEMVERYKESLVIGDNKGSLGQARPSSDDEEEQIGCKVILEDVYLESVSPPVRSPYGH
jgi:hypothetical protein